MTGSASPAGQALYKAESGTLIWTEPLPGGGSTVVKMYRRRGVAEPLRRCFIARRAEREYQLLRRMHEHGVACPEPIAWSHGRSRLHGRFDQLVTREIESARPLSDLLAEGAAPALDALFAAVRRLHGAGIAHGALYARNVLVAAAPRCAARFFLIDLAHGRAFSHDIADTRPSEYDLLDLLASLREWMPLDAAPGWLAAYGLPPGRAGALLACVPRHRRHRPWRHLRRIETDVRSLLDVLLRRAASRAPAATP